MNLTWLARSSIRHVLNEWKPGYEMWSQRFLGSCARTALRSTNMAQCYVPNSFNIFKNATSLHYYDGHDSQGMFSPVIITLKSFLKDVFLLSAMFLLPSNRFREPLRSKLLPIPRSVRTLTITHLRYIEIPTWLSGFMDKIANVSPLHCPIIPEETWALKNRNMTKESRSHVRILIYRTWAIGTFQGHSD